LAEDFIFYLFSINSTIMDIVKYLLFMFFLLP
jgi:hypothetical protein